MRTAFRLSACVGLATLAALVATPATSDAQVTVRSSVGSTRMEVGQPVDWVIATGGVGKSDEPQIPDVDWAAVQDVGTEQSLSWINGRTSARTIYRYRLTPLREGRFQVPAVTIVTGGRRYVTDPIPVEVLAPQGMLGGGGGGATSGSGDARLRLVASLAPTSVVVGEPVVLSMRLYQGVRLLADPVYSPPATPRFYVERSGPVHSQYGTGSDGSRWLIGETKTVLYPTVAGRLTVGSARVACVLADRDAVTGIEVEVQSRPVAVDVRPLPPAPPGFTGTVADARLTGALDRAAVRADEAVQVTFRLTGTGNLRLAAPPALPDLADFQVFDRRVEDSLDVDSGIPSGGKIVRYALLPRRSGPLALPAIEYVTFVPGEGYRTLTWPGARVEVTPGLSRGTGSAAASRAARIVPTSDPGGSPWTAARPFAGAAAVLFAAALWLGRVRLLPRRARGDASAEGGGADMDPAAVARRARDRASRLGELRAALAAARTRGDAAAFWRTAEEALAEASRGAPEEPRDDLGSRVAAARYAPGGGAIAAMDALSGPLGERLAGAQRDAAARGRMRAPRFARVGAAVLALAGVACLALGGLAVASHPDDAALRRTMALADAELRANQGGRAALRLVKAWNEGARRPGVALDLAVASWYGRRLGEAALWTERARRLDPRDPLVATLVDALREEGAWEALPVGARARTTGGEIAFAACLLLATALVVFVAGRRFAPARWTGRALFVVSIGLAVYAAQSGADGEAPGRAVVLRNVPLAPAPGAAGDVELEPGRAVWLDGRPRAGYVPVRAGSQVRGVVPEDAVRAL